MLPKVILGGHHSDARGTLFFNNDFDATVVKRIYFIENKNQEVVRAWQGHQVEQRWFSAVKGSFKIQLIAIDNWKQPSKKLEKLDFILTSESLDILPVPAGYACSIQSLEADSKLLVMANYALGEIEDMHRYASDYFE